MIEFSELINPSVLTVELSLLISIFIMVSGYIGVKLRSPMVLFFWGFSIFILIFIFLTGLNFMWFWGSIALTAIMIPIASIIQADL